MLISLCVFISINGCRNDYPDEFHAIEKTVQSFITAEEINDWEEIKNYLSGEALGEAIINRERSGIDRQILGTSMETELITQSLATVTADITALIEDSSEYKDRYTLKYSLINKNGTWLIYKSELVEQARPELRAGVVPDEAEKTLAEYFSLPYEMKKYREREFLAGKALPVLSAVGAGVYRNASPKQISPGFEILNIQCLGVGNGYCVATVTYKGGNDSFSSTAVVDMVEVDGKLKIARVDIASLEREG